MKDFLCVIFPSFQSGLRALGTCTMAASFPVAGITASRPVVEGDGPASVKDYSLQSVSSSVSSPGSPVLQLSSSGLPVGLDPKVVDG